MTGEDWKDIANGRDEDCFWTVRYEAEGRTWWAIGCIAGWTSTDEWTGRWALTRETAREVYRSFKSNPHNHNVRLVRVTRRPAPKRSNAKP